MLHLRDPIKLSKHVHINILPLDKRKYIFKYSYTCWHFQHAQAHQGTSGPQDTFLHISQPESAGELYSGLLTWCHEAAEKRFRNDS